VDFHIGSWTGEERDDQSYGFKLGCQLISDSRYVIKKRVQVLGLMW